MSFVLLELPQSLINNIYCFLDYKSLVRLSEVSKQGNNVVYAHIRDTRITEVDSLTIDEEPESSFREHKISVYIRASTPRHYAMWKTCFLRAFKTLNMDEFKIDDSEKVLEAEFDSCVELERFLNIIKPLMQNMRLGKLDIEYCDWDIIRMLSNVLQINSVTVLQSGEIESDISKLDTLLDLVTKLEPDTIDISFVQWTKDNIQSIVQLGSIVRKMDVIVYKETDKNCEVDIVSIARNVLSGKCQNLCIFETYVIRGISPTDVEKLLQFFHHSEIIVTFTTRNFPQTQAMMTNKIGEYEVAIHDGLIGISSVRL